MKTIILCTLLFSTIAIAQTITGNIADTLSVSGGSNFFPGVTHDELGLRNKRKCFYWNIDMGGGDTGIGWKARWKRPSANVVQNNNYYEIKFKMNFNPSICEWTLANTSLLISRSDYPYPLPSFGIKYFNPEDLNHSTHAGETISKIVCLKSGQTYPETNQRCRLKPFHDTAHYWNILIPNDGSESVNIDVEFE